MKRVLYPMADEENMESACWDAYNKSGYLLTLEPDTLEMIFGRVPKENEIIKITLELSKP